MDDGRAGEGPGELPGPSPLPAAPEEPEGLHSPFPAEGEAETPEPFLCPECDRAAGIGIRSAGPIPPRSRIGTRRRSCRTCNRWAQAVLRRTSRILREEAPEVYEAARGVAEFEAYRAVTGRDPGTLAGTPPVYAGGPFRAAAAASGREDAPAEESNPRTTGSTRGVGH